MLSVINNMMTESLRKNLDSMILEEDVFSSHIKTSCYGLQMALAKLSSLPYYRKIESLFPCLTPVPLDLF